MTQQILPLAKIDVSPRLSLAWLLPLGALAVAIFLVAQSLAGRGAAIVIRAQEGHGIEAGDSLRYRGIVVGRIEEVLLSEGLGGVDIHVRLDPQSDAIARSGSRFWIVRPRLSVDGVQGLDTVVGARHLAVDPGSDGAPRQTEFIALSQSPVVERLLPGGLELFLEASGRYGIQEGAPVTYRQHQVGEVLAVGLASDARAVETRIWIRPEYSQLVRSDSVFWETGGVEVDLSLTGGLSLDVGTLRSVLIGGIGLATPTRPGDPASTGARYPLHAHYEEEWLDWAPSLPVGGALLPPGQVPPRMVRAAQRWEQGLILVSDKARSGWLLPVTGGVIGPSDLLVADPKARSGSAYLEFAGLRLDLAEGPAWHDDGLARREAKPGIAPFPLDQVRALPEEPEDVLVFSDPGGAPMAIATSRLMPEGRGWDVDPAIAFGLGWNGSAVMSRADGALLGLLLVEGSSARVVPLPRP